MKHLDWWAMRFWLQHKSLAFITFALLGTTQLHGGIISKTIREGAEFFSGPATKQAESVIKRLDGAAQSSNSSTPNKILNPYAETDEPVDILGAIQRFNREKQEGRPEKFFQDLPNVSPNTLKYYDTATFENFYLWWFGTKMIRPFIQSMDEKFTADAIRVESTGTLDSEVRVKDDAGNFTFNYLVNPIIEEINQSDNANDYMSGIGELMSLMAISGRSGGLDPRDVVDLDRTDASELGYYTGFDAALSAVFSQRGEHKQAQFFKDHLDDVLRDLVVVDEYPTDDVSAVLGCLGLLYTLDGVHMNIFPQSESLYTKHCSKEKLSENLRLGIAALDSAIVEASDEQSRSALEALKFTSTLTSAFVHALFGEEQHYSVLRNTALSIAQTKNIDRDVVGLLLPLLAMSEAGFGNHQSAIQLCQASMVNTSDNLVLAWCSELMVGVFAQQKDLPRVKQLIEIQTRMAHPASEFFAPIDSKLGLARSLFYLEYLLYSMDGA